MKAHYKLFLSLAVASFIAFASCKDDEVLDLVEYPVNQPTITIDDMEGASSTTLKAVYKVDGTLELNGLVSRTYTFHFAASPEDATVNFEILHTNIPRENVEINTTKVVLPAGSTDVSVSVVLKDEDFSFAQSNYDAMTYELGVKANVEGYKIGTGALDSKVVIEKEAYIAACSIVGEKGNNISFDRGYSQGMIVNPDPISYTFKMKLDKPARKDIKVKLSTTGVEEQFMDKIAINPVEIIIPAGELYSKDVTWSITDDFLLTTAAPEIHKIVVTASIESEDPATGVNLEENYLSIMVNKVLKSFEFVSEKMDSWVDLPKTGWAVINSDGKGDGNNLIDGDGGKSGSDIYTSNDQLSFVVDMISDRRVTGLGIDYCRSRGTASSPKKVIISTSLDNENWIVQGTVDTPQSYNHYFQFYAPINARYVKFELEGRYNSYIDLTEVYVYGTE